MTARLVLVHACALIGLIAGLIAGGHVRFAHALDDDALAIGLIIALPR